MFGDKLKKFINKNTDEKESSGEEEGNNKRKIENLVFFFFLLIITIVIINIILNEKKTTTKQGSDVTTKQLATTQIGANIEENMSNNISTINTEDELEMAEKEVQKILNKFIDKVEETLKNKEKERMSVEEWDGK